MKNQRHKRTIRAWKRKGTPVVKREIDVEFRDVFIMTSKASMLDAAVKLLLRWGSTLYWQDRESPKRQKELADLAFITGKFLGTYERYKKM